MKVELHINGRYEIELRPETDIERAVVKEMAARAEKGQPVTLSTRGPADAERWSYFVGVDNS
jgi:hypothetical protein